MWWHDPRALTRRPSPRGALPPAVMALALGLCLVQISACTVRPLYADAAMLPGSRAEPAAGLPSVYLAPAKTRDAQEVRNQLIFLLNGGAGQPADARYTVALNILTVSEPSATIQVRREEEPTSATVTMTSAYVISDNETGKLVAQGRRDVLSSYDTPRQEFAVLRARIDAENRAARELAELLKLAIIQTLERLQQTPVAAK